MKQATINSIRAKAKAKAETLANEAQKKLVDKYKMGIAQFYTEYEPKKYERTYNFKNNSYASYFEQTGARFYGGIIIGDKKMDSYDEDNVFFDVLYNPTHTWHGTKDLPASFVLYDYMHDFYKNLVADFRRRCTVNE